MTDVMVEPSAHSCRYVTEADLEFFKDRVERDVELPAVGKWQHMTDLNLETLKYSAWRRRLAVSTCHTYQPSSASHHHINIIVTHLC